MTKIILVMTFIVHAVAFAQTAKSNKAAAQPLTQEELDLQKEIAAFLTLPKEEAQIRLQQEKAKVDFLQEKIAETQLKLDEALKKRDEALKPHLLSGGGIVVLTGFNIVILTLYRSSAIHKPGGNFASYQGAGRAPPETIDTPKSLMYWRIFKYTARIEVAAIAAAGAYYLYHSTELELTEAEARKFQADLIKTSENLAKTRQFYNHLSEARSKMP